MSHVSLRRSLLALPLLSLTLSTSAVSAAPIPWRSFLAEEGRSALLFLEAGLLDEVHASPRTPKAGCTINPNGQPQCSPAATPKHGCGIDPDGHTVCTP